MEVLKSLNKIFQEHLLNDQVFRVVDILQSLSKIFEKWTSKKSIFRVGSLESILQTTLKIPVKKFPFCKAFLSL